MKKLKPLIIVVMMVLAVQSLLAQSIPTSELPLLTTITNSGTGASINPVGAQFYNDALNNDVFAAYTPVTNMTVSLTNQQFTGYSYGTANYGGSGFSTLQSTGLVFGIYPTQASAAMPQGGFPTPRYNRLGTYGGSGGPQRSMFTSNPTATGAQLGTGINPIENTPIDQNGGIEIFTTAQMLYYDTITYPRGSRVYYGNVVFTFSQPVKNPVLHIAGLGGSYRFLRTGGNAGVEADWYSTYFTTELELVNPGYTSTLMSGNAFMALAGNNIVNNNHINPNGGSVNDPSETINNNLGAATGSVRVNGLVTSLTYRVYLQGGSGSQFAWAKDAAYLGTPRDPFTGDIWYVSASFDKPTQQITGSVYIDKDVTDGDIHKSFLVDNDRTNAGGTLHANLISGGVVVATVPISATGDYVFDNVAIGTYTVQVGTTAGVVGNPPPLPVNWARTGEFIGAGPGTDGINNGTSASIVIAANTIVNNVDFGIRAGNCPNNILYQNPLALTDYFGGFEMVQNFHPTGINLSNGPGRIYAITPLAPAAFSITSDPNSFNNALSSYKALGGQNQMVINPTVPGQIIYSLIDSAGLNAQNNQTHFLSFLAGSALRGWFANSTATNAVVKIRIYDADVPARIFLDTDVTVTGGAGSNSWKYWNMPWQVNYGVPGQVSQTKKVRFDIISVNGAPFSIDELCFIEPAGSPVPITLSDFTANKTGCTANLVWKTSNESNSDRFEVEVSTNGSIGYSTSGTVSAAGYSNTTKNYQFSFVMESGINYYFRLKMIDKDGSFKYSDIRTLQCSKGKAGIVIAPNPVTDKFTISGMDAGKNIIAIYASNGQLVHTEVIAQTRGDVYISYLSPGLYTVKVTSETGNAVVSKLIKF